MKYNPRKLMYIPSSNLWESIKDSAKLANRSVSNYLVSLHRAHSGQVVSSSPCLCGEDHNIGGQSSPRIDTNNLPPPPDVNGGPFYCPTCKESCATLTSAGTHCMKPDPVQKVKDDLAKLTQGNPTFNPMPKKGK